MKMICHNPHPLNTPTGPAITSLAAAKSWVERYSTHDVPLLAADTEGNSARAGRGSGWYKGCPDGWVCTGGEMHIYRDGRWTLETRRL